MSGPTLVWVKAVLAGCMLAVVAGPWAHGEVGQRLEGLPEPSPELVARVASCLRYPSVRFLDWHPRDRDILIAGRHGDRVQLLEVALPLGGRRPLTAVGGGVMGGRWRPGNGSDLVFSQDELGNESPRICRLDPLDGGVRAITAPGTRNVDPLWSPSGRWLAYATSGTDGGGVFFRLVRPEAHGSDGGQVALQGDGWSLQDWSPDEREWLALCSDSARVSRLYRVELATGRCQPVTVAGEDGPVFHGAGRYLPGGREVLVTSDRDFEYRSLARIDLGTGRERPFGPRWGGDVEEFEVESGGRWVAALVNLEGVSRLNLVDLRDGRVREVPELPRGVAWGLRWRPNGREVGLCVDTLRAPSEAYSVDVRTLAVTRWTAGSGDGAPGRGLLEPERVRVRSFDGLELTGYLYRPDPRRFPGRRPLVVHLHGGPELQARPIYPMRWMYFLEHRGVAVLEPNVRGSAGYGKAFLGLDDGLRREDAVRDVGAFLDAMEARPDIDGQRMAVHGVSYGGYLALASLVHHGSRLRCGVDLMGISSFPAFLRGTREDRRDLRRAEYGDERDPEMAGFLERISPIHQVGLIRKPVLVVHGGRDTRVPASESERLVSALRAQGGEVASFLAPDEGHGFWGRRSAEKLAVATVQFLERHLGLEGE